ncbi:hypothetical protein [Pseudomonas defluvii]|nr:hypothetical protein [Pseudomonas defluvii]
MSQKSDFDIGRRALNAGRTAIKAYSVNGTRLTRAGNVDDVRRLRGDA